MDNTQMAPAGVAADALAPSAAEIPLASASQDALLFAVAQGTALSTGRDFFHDLTRNLANALGLRWAAVTEFLPERATVRTLAFWNGDSFLENFEYPLIHTPCEAVIAGAFCHYPSAVQSTFPDHHELVTFGIDSYMGVPLLDAQDRVLGHLYIMDDKPMPPAPICLAVFRIFAARAASELNRVRATEALVESEARFHRLADTAPSLVFQADGAGAVTYLSERWREVFGTAPEAGLAAGWIEFVDPNDRETVRQEWMRAVAGGAAWEREMRIRRADGESGWALVRTTPVAGERGSRHFVGVVTDITRMKEAAAALREREERLTAVLDSAMDAVLTLDDDGRVVVWNAEAERLFGWSEQEAAALPLERLAGNALREHIGSCVARVRAGETLRSLRLPDGLGARRRAGAEFPVGCAVSSISAAGRSLLTITLRSLEERERAQTRIEALSRENQYLREQAAGARAADPIIGQSASLRKVLNDIELVAPTESTVLIEGETGVGKELVARALHDSSERRGKPFVKVNCAALPPNLVESEFFGHEKGAFTGAVTARAGRFELADGGTIFLDEVGEVSPEVQVKLLRVLQEQEFERVGGTKTIRVNVRVLAATNRDLGEEVASGAFRADLYYRLCVFPIRVPPLRERAGDIPLLARHFAAALGANAGRAIHDIDPESLDRLVRYPWQGNIRELRNVIERAVILCRGPVLRIDEALLRVGHAAGATPGGLGRTLEEVERDHIRAVLEQTGWAVAGPGGAAEVLGMPPSTLRSRMQRLGVGRDTAR